MRGLGGGSGRRQGAPPQLGGPPQVSRREWGEQGSSAFPASSLPFLNTSLSSAGVVASAPALVFITGF